MDTPDLERLTILERAHLLHDATLRRHGELLDRLDEARGQHDVRLIELRHLAEGQARLLETLTAIAAHHEERMAAVQQTLAAIKDMLERGNGR